ncbi:MAG: DUF4465 domain-containing protein [Paludibacteraceae bacterium]|nr:DUF4465 domain-containing protein [Paludibacteraceae bacterium]
MKTLNFKTWVMLLCVASTMMFVSCKEKDEPDDPTNIVPENPTPEPETPQPETPQLAYELRTLTFEDADAKGIVNFNTGDETWSSLIDEQQYNGTLLYPTDGAAPLYGWHDENNTEIISTFTNSWNDNKFWGGGIAISNYIDNNLSNGDADHQLSVPSSNGSNNFAVTYCTAEFSFADGIHEIESLSISPTIYQLNVSKNGNAFAKALTGKGDYLSIVFTGYNNDVASENVVKFDLVRDGNFVETWTEVSLLALGKVDKVVLTMESNDMSYGYLNQPQYFAFDNVKVRFDKELEF